MKFDTLKTAVVLLCGLWTGSAFATAQTGEAGFVQGVVQVFGQSKQPMTPDKVIVSVAPLDGQILSMRAAKTFSIRMRNKTYKPSHLVVQVGDTVAFLNQDRIKHNVFSSASGNRFDLGSFKRGKRPDIAFKNPGLVKIYCNLHQKMFTYVQVMMTDRSTVTGTDGQYRIDHLLPGRYRLDAWHVRGAMSRTILVPHSGMVVDVEIDGSQWTKRTRPKKSGVYPTKPQKSLREADWDSIQASANEDDDAGYNAIDDDEEGYEDDEEDEDEEEDTEEVEVGGLPSDAANEDDFEDF